MALTVLLAGTDMGYLSRLAGPLSDEGFNIMVTADRDGLAQALQAEEVSLVLCDLQSPDDLRLWVPGFAEYPGRLLFVSDLTLSEESFGGLTPVEVFPRHLDIDALVERVRKLEGA